MKSERDDDKDKDKFNKEKKRSNAMSKGDRDSSTEDRARNLCLIHPNDNHLTRKCQKFKSKNLEERGKLVKDLEACALCYIS